MHFHGSKNMEGHALCQQEDVVLNINYANQGASGKGIYFSNNAAYS